MAEMRHKRRKGRSKSYHSNRKPWPSKISGCLWPLRDAWAACSEGSSARLQPAAASGRPGAPRPAREIRRARNQVVDLAFPDEFFAFRARDSSIQHTRSRWWRISTHRHGSARDRRRRRGAGRARVRPGTPEKKKNETGRRRRRREMEGKWQWRNSKNTLCPRLQIGCKSSWRA